MKKIKFRGKEIAISELALIISNNPLIASEKIINKKKVSFERCLDVISASENKLAISPLISDLSNKKRIAIFTLSDGSLTITCDGEKEILTVSTKTN